jgi:integrase
LSKSLEVWEDELSSKSKQTKYIYRRSLKQFLEYAGWTHEQLFDIHRDAIKSEDPRDWHVISRKLKSYMKYLVDEKGLSTAHAHQAQKAVASFLSANGLTFKMNGSKPFTVEYMGQNIVDAEGIRYMLEATADPKNKALIMAAKDSGLRVSDIVKLNVSHVKEAIDKKQDFVLIDLQQKKGGHAVKAILGPESLEAIRRWLDSRPVPFDENSPLFTKTEGSGKFRERLTSLTASNAIMRVARKARLKKVSIHSLRKFHTTFCTLGKIPETWIAIIQGRKIRDSRSAYMKPTDGMLVKAYSEAYPNLRVYGAVAIEEIARLREELEAVKQKFEASILMSEEPKISRVILDLFDKMSSRERVEYLQRLKDGENPPEDWDKHLDKL